MIKNDLIPIIKIELNKMDYSAKTRDELITICKEMKIKGDLCMDPFAGSGTLGRACYNMKRDYILFDINPEAKKIFDKEYSL